ncbi:hypothetical protein ACLOJK_023770 [Asimina triloba]
MVYNIGEMVPIAIVAGMVVVAIAIGAHTAKQQLLHSPSVHITKKKRETMPELVDPDATAVSGGKFIGKSFLRKVAQIQEPDPAKVISLPAHGDVYKRFITRF